MNHINSISNDDDKARALEDFNTYIKSLPNEYSAKIYKVKAEMSANITTNVVDEDFKKAALDAIDYVLFGNFHEDVKYGENHIAERTGIAKSLYSNSNYNIKLIGAKAITEYFKNGEMWDEYERGVYSDSFFKNDMISFGVDLLNIIAAQNYSYYYPSSIFADNRPRETESLRKWVDKMEKIALEPEISAKAKSVVVGQLSGYLDKYNAESGVFDGCRNNKFCIKEISDNLDYINDCLVRVNGSLDSDI